MEENNKKDPICIYHKGCTDGFGAAWAVWRNAELAGINMEFHAGVYQNPPPDCTDRDVIIVDFSYKRPTMNQIIELATGLYRS